METFLSSEFLAIFSFLFFVIKFLVLNQRNLKATKLYYVIPNGLLFSNLFSKVLLATSTTTIKPFLFKNYSIFPLCFVTFSKFQHNALLPDLPNFSETTNHIANLTYFNRIALTCICRTNQHRATRIFRFFGDTQRVVNFLSLSK
jgi:hypothetical protein